MSKKKLQLIFCVITIIPMFALAQESHFYFGSNLGAIAYSGQDKELMFDDKNPLTWEVYTGIQTKEWLSFDLGYIFVNDADLINGGHFSMQGIDIAARPTYHINDKWSVYSKIGFVAYKAINTQRDRTDRSLASSTALGIEYKFNNNFYLGSKLQYISQLGGESTGEADLLSYTLGFRFVPSGKMSAPIPTSAPIISPVMKEPVFISSEDALMVYFDFDSADITETERLKLLDFINQFKGQTINQIILSGFSDSLGSNAYNQTLSLQRAEQLRTIILANLPITEDQILLNHYGEESPIADNSSEQGRAKNRRVKVQIMFELRREN